MKSRWAGGHKQRGRGSQCGTQIPLCLSHHVGERKERVLCPTKGVSFAEDFQHFAHSENFMALLLIHTEEELNFALQYTSKAAC